MATPCVVLCATGVATLLCALPLYAVEPSLPEPHELPAQEKLPNPLVALDGTRVDSPQEWFAQRRPELKRLFQHYMYGYLPEKPQEVTAVVTLEDPEFLGGKATLKQVNLRFGPDEAPNADVLLVIPNQASAPAPCFVGLNFCGNHALLDDPRVALPRSWMPSRCPGVVDNRATDAGRGARRDVWSIDQAIERGYAVATVYNGDFDPDKPDFTDGVHAHFGPTADGEIGPHDWGTIAAWAWGLHRVVDYLVADDAIDRERICVVGHSRLGKTALLAAAMDERIALAIPHQAGCGGTAPSRGTVGESVERINTSFPHWFNDTFPKFNQQVDRLPFDQNGLVALVAPRPVLFSNAVQDTWADPRGQFDVLKAAVPVYRLLGAGDADGTVLAADEPPPVGKLVDSTLGYYIRPGKHSMTREDWKVFLDFADAHLRD